MRKWRPAPERWVAACAAASRRLGEPRTMVGYSAAFAGGNMFAGLHRYASSLPPKLAGKRAAPKRSPARKRRA